jgi:glycosyltransferase involved in cell wall biosynthesis
VTDEPGPFVRASLKLRVLVVIDSLSLGGAETLLATLARAGPNAGLEFDVISLGFKDEERTATLPVLETAGLAPRFLSLRRLVDPAALLRLTSAIRASRCDLVHAHLQYSATLAPIAARLTGRPAVCTFHHVPGPLSGLEAIKERLAVASAARSRRVIFVSHASMYAFQARYERTIHNSAVVHNGVDLAEFNPEPASLPRDLQIPTDALTATLVGAMRPHKGHATAIAAWAQIARRLPEARLLLVGSGPMERELRRQAASLRVQDVVIFAGRRHDVARVMRASTLAILPSQTEALPTTLMEAAAAGKAVVATNVGGVPEVVRNGETGILVPVGDVELLAAATIDLLIDRGRRAAMGRAARRLAEARFDSMKWARQLRLTYEHALAGKYRRCR